MLESLGTVEESIWKILIEQLLKLNFLLFIVVDTSNP